MTFTLFLVFMWEDSFELSFFAKDVLDDNDDTFTKCVSSALWRGLR